MVYKITTKNHENPLITHLDYLLKSGHVHPKLILKGISAPYELDNGDKFIILDNYEYLKILNNQDKVKCVIKFDSIIGVSI